MPAARAASLPRIETCEIAIQQILDADIPADVRDLLVAAQNAVRTLKPTTNAADHTPVYTTAQDGSQNVIGCSCGAVPKSRASRSSTMANFFIQHLGRVGVTRPRHIDPVYTDGPYTGMTWNQRYAIEHPTR